MSTPPARPNAVSLVEALAVTPEAGQDQRPYALSPDGSTIALQWYSGGDWQIYLLSAAGGEPQRVGELPDRCSSPLFSPDGRFLYFARDDRGSERYDVYRYELATEMLENLLPDTAGFSPLPDIDVSPDGSCIAMTAPRDGGYSVAVMPAAVARHGEGIRHVSQHPYTESSPRWSPDGRLLAVTSGTRGQDRAVIIIDPESGARRVVGGSDDFYSCELAWSPDSRRIAFSGGLGDHPAIGVYDLESGAVTWAWSGELDAHDPAWSPDGAGLAFLVDRDAETGLRHLDLTTGVTTEYSAGPGNHYYPTFSADGAALHCVLSRPDRPTDLYRVELGSGDATRLTNSLPAGLKSHHFVSGHPIWFTSRDHLTDVPGLLVTPDEPNGAGVIIVHGGPTWHHSNEWDALRQALVAAGVTVLHPNYRGSDGYGRRWQLANRWLMGQGEVLDVVAGHDVLVDSGCDPSRIAITGRSWGGFLTMAAVTQFPDIWAAGVAGVPFFDFIDSQLDSDVREDLRWWDRENTGDIEKDRAKLAYYSPINHLEAIRAPLLLLGGALDSRCPPRQLFEVADRLAALGRICEHVVYENEGHEISGFEHRRDCERRTVAFILEHTGCV